MSYLSTAVSLLVLLFDIYMDGYLHPILTFYFTSSVPSQIFILPFILIPLFTAVYKLIASDGVILFR